MQCPSSDAITLPLGSSQHGSICNPWLYEGHYYPLLDWIAFQSEFSSGLKIFHAVCLRRGRTCKRIGVKRDWFNIDKLVDESGLSTSHVYAFIQLLKKRGLIGNAWLGGSWHLIGEYCEELDLISETEYSLIHKIRIPYPLITAGGVSDAALVLYGILCRVAGKRGWGWATKEKLSELCGRTIRTVQYSIQELESNRFISADRENRIRRKSGSGAGASRFYFLDHELFDS